jgi:hypothetical protein
LSNSTVTRWSALFRYSENICNGRPDQTGTTVNLTTPLVMGGGAGGSGTDSSFLQPGSRSITRKTMAERSID